VNQARVEVEGRTIGEIGRGLLLLVGIHGRDSDAEIAWMAQKVAALRIFEDDDGKMNRSGRDVGAGVLAVSQFTLYGNVAKGNRPSFIDAAGPEVAEPLFGRFVEALKGHFERVETGRFGADMQVHLVNDGPVTIWLERGAARAEGS
jgi:D-tyrosyl-tRNA(Tyr) deacylase